MTLESMTQDMRARLEEVLADNENLRRLARSVVHDINNLMAVITGYSELMLRHLRPSDPLHRNAESIKKATEWGSALTQQILASMRKQPTAATPVDLNELVANITRVIQPLIGERIEMASRLEPGLPRVNVNPGQMGQVLMNLVINARDAMPSGGRLLLETCRVGSEVVLSVSDTGEGTTFAVFLPALHEGDGVVSADGAVTLQFTTRTVLLVEDEGEVRGLIRDILKLYGYAVLEARDRADALEICAQHDGRIDLVISSVTKPGPATDEMVQDVMTVRPGIGVLYLSGYLEDDEEADGAARFGPVLRKPFTVAALTDAVRRVLAAATGSAGA